MTTYDDADLVQRRSERLAGLLAVTDLPMRPMALPIARIQARAASRVLRRWRIAAAIALLIAGAAGVPPVRAWIVDTVHSAWLSVTGRAAPPVAAAPASAPAITMGRVSFPAPDPLLVRIATRQQAGGSITIEASNGPAVDASITGEPNAAELVVMPEGLRIVNRRASTAGYVIRVPAGLSRLTVQIAQERPRVFMAPVVGDHWVVDLGVRKTAP